MNAAQALMGKIVDLIINPAIGVIFAVAGLLFVWGIIQFLKGLSEGEVNSEGKQHMIYGVLGMFIMVSVFGIISLISNTLGLSASPRSSIQIDQSRLNNIQTPSFGQ
jgi:hypothetical protein